MVVTAEYFACPLQKVLDALTARLRLYPEFEVFWAIIELITIGVMHVLVREEMAA